MLFFPFSEKPEEINEGVIIKLQTQLNQVKKVGLQSLAAAVQAVNKYCGLDEQRRELCCRALGHTRSVWGPVLLLTRFK